MININSAKYIIEKFVLLLCPTFYDDFILSSIKHIAATDFSRQFCYTAVTSGAAKFLLSFRTHERCAISPGQFNLTQALPCTGLNGYSSNHDYVFAQ